MAPSSISLDRVTYLGSGLSRPECVLCTRAGDVFASDSRGGVMHILPDGTQRLYLGSTSDLDRPLFPNGVALERDGSFLVTQLSDGAGGVFRLGRDGSLRPVLREVVPRPPGRRSDPTGGVPGRSPGFRPGAVAVATLLAFACLARWIST